MPLCLHSDVDDFASVAAAWYARRPMAHTIELALLRERVAADDTPVLMTVWDGDGAELLGAAIRTPPLPLLCGGLFAAPQAEVVGDMVGADCTGWGR